MPAVSTPFSYGMRFIKNSPEFIPLVSLVGTVCASAVLFMGYSLATKPDVRVIKSSGLPPWERVKPTESRKIITINPKLYRENPELEKLRREIGSYKI